MEGSLEMSGYKLMQRYESAEAHAFQPFPSSLEEHRGSVEIPDFFQPPPRTPIPAPPQLIIDMFVPHAKRKAAEEIEEEDVKIVAPPAPKKKGGAAAKKPHKKIVKKDKEEDEDLSSKHWKDADVETMISLRGEMESEFLKNAKKQGMIFACVIF